MKCCLDCWAPVTFDGRVWVDDTGGDCCPETNEPHRQSLPPGTPARLDAPFSLTAEPSTATRERQPDLFAKEPKP